VTLPDRPTIFEINTAVWLRELGCTLDAVPAAEWAALAELPVDAVWLMGVWERSPAGLEIARVAFPDLNGPDVIGSPYCVRDYVVDERFGGRDGLAAAREQLAARGLGLILDYVPNHVAPDHPWLGAQPACLLQGSEEELSAQPGAFVRTPDGIFANGRDPYFPPWPDVVQLNAFSSELRQSVAGLLDEIAGQCDGIRCDMAMLMTNEVFTRTWGERAGQAPDRDYWPPLIEAVKAAHPGFSFIAEAYWDMEWTLQQQGFDFCYDKRLYDRLAGGGAADVRSHLQAESAYQEGLLRFIENHDEPRAAATFGPGKERAAAVVMSTLQGARMYYQGQFDGRREHTPVFVDRAADEPVDLDLRAFYLRLLRAIAESGLREGEWQLLDCHGWPDNDSFQRLVAWSWTNENARHLVVVNLSDAAAQARVELPWNDLRGRGWTLDDLLSGARFERDGDELAGPGLYVGLDACEFNFIHLHAA
jgi:glycosidase